MSSANAAFTLEQYLQQLGEEHSSCLVYLACNWNGNAQMYRNMVAEICQTATPAILFIYQPLNEPPFNQMKTLSHRIPMIYFLKNGQVKAVIEGVLPRHQIRERIQLFNTS